MLGISKALKEDDHVEIIERETGQKDDAQIG